MGKTTRRASIWMEFRFKYGDSVYPEDNSEFFNKRYQNKMRNGTTTYYHENIDPLSMKTIHWAEYGTWIKAYAKRVARHRAKILVVKLTQQILLEQQMDLEEQLIEDNWYDDDLSCFDFSYSDEAWDYAEQRRLEELMEEQEQQDWWSTYDPYENYDY